jgi:molecular chaperone DnaK
MKLGEAMYQRPGADGGPAAPGGPEAGAGGAEGEDVVDAEFEEVDDDERKRSA